MRSKISVFSTSRGPNGGVVGTFIPSAVDPDSKAFYAIAQGDKITQTLSKEAVSKLGIVVGKSYYMELTEAPDYPEPAPKTMSKTITITPEQLASMTTKQTPTPTPPAPQPLND